MISALKYFWAQVLLANPGLVSLWRVPLGMASVYRSNRVSLIVDLEYLSVEDSDLLLFIVSCPVHTSDVLMMSIGVSCF